MNASTNTASVALEINGMSCGHCLARVDKTLKSLAGVDDSTVRIGSATVAFDPAIVSANEIAAAVTRAGYPARAADSVK